MLITYCVCDFLFYGYPCIKKVKRDIIVPEKMVDLGLLIRDIFI